METIEDILVEKKRIEEELTKIVREFKSKLPDNVHLDNIRVLYGAHIVLDIGIY